MHAQGVEINVNPIERLALDVFILHGKVYLPVIIAVKVDVIAAIFVLIEVDKVAAIHINFAARSEELAHTHKELRHILEALHHSGAVHKQNYGVEAVAKAFIEEIDGSGIAHAAFAHHFHRQYRYIYGTHILTHLLQSQGMATATGSHIQYFALSQAKRLLLYGGHIGKTAKQQVDGHLIVVEHGRCHYQFCSLTGTCIVGDGITHRIGFGWSKIGVTFHFFDCQ